MRRLFPLLILLLLCSLCASAFADGFTAEVKPLTDGETLLHGYDTNKKEYVYVSFGSYPFERDGTRRPCLWRVLSVENDYAYLLSEWVVDWQPFHSVKVDQPDWPDYDLYTYMQTTMKDSMFTPEEQSCLRYTYELGALFIMDNKESMKNSHGFRRIMTEPQWERKCPPTPYVKAQKDTYVNPNGCTWYWSRTCRHVAAGGYEHIFGYDGHISMHGFTDPGGVRPACYVDCSRLDKATGSGTETDPYVFQIVD